MGFSLPVPCLQVSHDIILVPLGPVSTFWKAIRVCVPNYYSTVITANIILQGYPFSWLVLVRKEFDHQDCDAAAATCIGDLRRETGCDGTICRTVARTKARFLHLPYWRALHTWQIVSQLYSSFFSEHLKKGRLLVWLGFFFFFYAGASSARVLMSVTSWHVSASGHRKVGTTTNWKMLHP